MDFSSIKTFIVGGDKIARPKNIHIAISEYGNEYSKDWKAARKFEKEAQHYAVDESLTPGEYEAEKLELVWQFWARSKSKGYMWADVPKSLYETLDIKYENFGIDNPTVEKRQILRLKQQDKTEPDQIKINKYINDLIAPTIRDMGHIRNEDNDIYDEYFKNSAKEPKNLPLQLVSPDQPESPKFGEWISVKIKRPKKRSIILVCYQYNEMAVIFYEGLQTIMFTHWMPLPSPPKTL